MHVSSYSKRLYREAFALFFLNIFMQDLERKQWLQP